MSAFKEDFLETIVNVGWGDGPMLWINALATTFTSDPGFPASGIVSFNAPSPLGSKFVINGTAAIGQVVPSPGASYTLTKKDMAKPYSAFTRVPASPTLFKAVAFIHLPATTTYSLTVNASNPPPIGLRLVEVYLGTISRNALVGTPLVTLDGFGGGLPFIEGRNFIVSGVSVNNNYSIDTKTLQITG